MKTMTADLAASLGGFQQACVGFTGPYNDAHDRLCKLMDTEPGAEITEDDLTFVRELVNDLQSTLESLEGDMAPEWVVDEITEVEIQCEHGREADYCTTCYPEDEN